jgi:hypothetical protein
MYNTSGMTSPQHAADVEQYMPINFEGSWMSDYLGEPDTYLPSVFRNHPLQTDPHETTLQLPQYLQGAHYQSVQRADGVSSGSEYLLLGQDLTYLDNNNTAQADFYWPDVSQIWPQQDGCEMDQGTMTDSFKFNPRLVDPGATPSYAPIFGDTIFSDDSGYPKSGDQDLDIQTSNRKDQVEKEKACVKQMTSSVPFKVIKRRKWSAGHKQKSKRPSHMAKACTVKRVYGTESLDHHGNTVDHLAIPNIRDAAAFLGCSRNTVKSALGKTGDEKGVVLGVWKVEECDSNAPAEISCPSNLLGTISSWQTSQPLSNIGDGTRNNTAALTQAPGDALDLLENPAGMTWLTALHSTPIDRAYFMPHFAVPSKTSSHRGRGKELSNRGHVVNLYHVSQQHGKAFDLEGKLVSSAFITTDRRVSAVTSASGHSLDSAKLHTNIELGVWRISYLGKIRKGEDVNQEIFAGVDPDLARSNPTGSREHRPCHDCKWESSHEQSVQTYNLDQHNQHEACEANQQSTPVTQMASESSLASVHLSDHVASTQPVGIEGTISNQQEATQHTTTQPIPAIVRTTVQRQQYTRRARKS